MNSKGRVSATAFLLLIIGLIVGGGGMYFYMYNTYQPLIQDYENQIDDLNSEVSDLSSTISAMETKITDYETQISSRDIQISNYRTQVSNLESQISNYRSQVTSLQYQVNSYSTQISNLETRLDGILSITVIQHYEWVYGSWLWSDRYQWDLPFTMSLYCEYFERPRPTEWENWVDMAKDSNDDYYIDQMVQKINSAAIKEGFKETEKVNFVIAFVQSLPYTVDSVTTTWDEYPRYPIETLFDRGGDCEDTSILVAALLDRMGYDTALLFLSHENHIAVGVDIEGVYGSYYSYNGKKYFYLETTGEGWKIGQIPSDFDDTRAYIYPLNP